MGGFLAPKPSDWAVKAAASGPGMFDCDEEGLRLKYPKEWVEAWQGLPEFTHECMMPSHCVKVNFACVEDRDAFAELVSQTITDRTKSMWYPPQSKNSYIGTRWKTREPVDPKYPVYIVSKGRWKRRYTAESLERMQVPYRIVVEEHQYNDYAQYVDKSKLLILPKKYLEDYDACDDLGLTKSKGPGAARNFCWDHSISEGAARHWVMDDNIHRFYRFNRNTKIACDTGAIFRAAEDFVDRYSNAAVCGFQYNMFTPRKVNYLGPYTLNTRIYSCLLIDNAIPFRWRGRYNEDTDLSLRVLKAGLCTIEFYAFLQNKLVTQSVAGGNHEDFYKKEGTMNKSKMLCELHPDVSRLVWRFHRWHHVVNYWPFRKNKLLLRPGVVPGGGINEYGMYLGKASADELRLDAEADARVKEDELVPADSGDEEGQDDE